MLEDIPLVVYHNRTTERSFTNFIFGETGTNTVKFKGNKKDDDEI